VAALGLMLSVLSLDDNCQSLDEGQADQGQTGKVVNKDVKELAVLTSSDVEQLCQLWPIHNC